jgi:tetratricopeptide (TPR) repeat protein
MRKTLVPLACAAIAALSASALADERTDCMSHKDNIVAIRGCSEIIRRDPKDGIAYYLRGNALARNNDLGQAIVDFNKAIALNPGFAPAYDRRASAYVAKGDYTSAVADATRSAELTSKKASSAAKGTMTSTKSKTPDASPKKGDAKAATVAAAKEPPPKDAPPSAPVTKSPPVFNPFGEPGSAP